MSDPPPQQKTRPTPTHTGVSGAPSHTNNAIIGNEEGEVHGATEDTKPTTHRATHALLAAPSIHKYGEGDEDDTWQPHVRAKPGAIAVTGIHRPVPQQFSLQEQKQELDEVATVATSRVVAEVVDEDQLVRDVLNHADERLLLRELLARRSHDVAVQTENVTVAVMSDETSAMKKDTNSTADEPLPKQNRVTWRIIAAVVVLVIVAVVVTTIILVSQSKQSQQSQPSPTSTPVSRLDAFRSLLLDLDVSSRQQLYNTASAQYQALNWLANEDEARISTASVETSIVRYVLAVLYFATNGVHWLNQSNFLSASSICNWHANTTEMVGSTQRYYLTGVTCSSTNVVEGIKFKKVLLGTIPSELGKLSGLADLVLSENRLLGTIPTEFGKLSKLYSLILYHNQLIGYIPTELGKLSRLTNLVLDTNLLTGTIPADLAKFSNLRSLHLCDNDLTGTIPTEFGKLTSLTDLCLGTNQLTGTIPTELGMLSSLDNLDLHQNSLRGTVPTVLGSLSDLATLLLMGNNFTGNLTAAFCTGSQTSGFLTLSADCNSSKLDCTCCTCF